MHTCKQLLNFDVGLGLDFVFVSLSIGLSFCVFLC